MSPSKPQQLQLPPRGLGGGKKKRFVYSCSECSCILNVSAALEPVGDTLESLENRCPGCGSALEARISCRSTLIPEAWSEISRSAHSSPRAGPLRRRSCLGQPSSLRGLSSRRKE